MYTKKLVVPQTSDLLEKLAPIFFHNFHRERSVLKLLIKKVIAENQCEKHKNRVYEALASTNASVNK